jgi:hypothetical protein
MKIQHGDESVDVLAVIFIKNKERCLDEKRRVAETMFCPDAASVKMATDGGYELLSFVFPDGSQTFEVKPEQLAHAERIAQAVDRQFAPKGGIQ